MIELVSVTPRGLIDGFDYVLQKPVQRTRKEWQALMVGNRRRVENGETFIHGKDARIVAEVYANVTAPTQTSDE